MAEKQTAKIGEGRPGPGRRPGVPNRTTTLLKDAIILAAEDVGEDGEGKDGLQGYLRGLAKSDQKAFATLLGKVLPLHVAHSGSIAHDLAHMTDAELMAVAAGGAE